MLNEFTAWADKIKPEITEISGILSERLSDEPEELISDLKDAEVWNHRMSALLAQANSWLDQFSLFAIPAKEGRTEMDRKILLDSETSPIRLMRDTLESLCDSIKQRLILGESILSYEKQFIERDPKPMQRLY